jgi:Cu+-exporting ATPase
MTVDPVSAKYRFEHHEQSYYFCSSGCREKFAADPGKYLPAEAIDPICGMTVDPGTAKHVSGVAGAPRYFCSAGCKAKFEAEPDKYRAHEVESGAAGSRRPSGDTPVETDPGAVYTCPMHPEVEQIGPGSCPICGMALEPKVVSRGEVENPELTDMTRRLWIGVVLT